MHPQLLTLPASPLLRKPHPRGFQSPNPARSVSVRLTYPDASALARELGAASRARREHCSPYRFWGSPWAEIAPSRCRAVIKAAEGGGSEGVSKGRERVRGRGHAYSSSTALRAVMKIKSPGQGMSQKPPDVSASHPWNGWWRQWWWWWEGRPRAPTPLRVRRITWSGSPRA